MVRRHRGGGAPDDAAADVSGGHVAHHQVGSDPRCQVGARTPIVHRSATGAVTMTVHVPVAYRQRGGRKALVSPAGAFAPSTPASRPSDYPPAVKALARAFRWQKLIETGAHSTIQDIAKAEGINPSYVSRVLRLTLLAPELIERTLADAPASVDDLTLPLPARWQDQTSLFLCSHPLGTSIVEQSR